MKIAFCVIKSRVYLRCVRSENWFTLQFYDFIKNYALFCIYLQYTHSYTHTGTHIYVLRIRRVGKLKQQETQLCTLEQNMQSKRATHTQTTVQGATVCVCVGVCVRLPTHLTSSKWHENPLIELHTFVHIKPTVLDRSYECIFLCNKIVHRRRRSRCRKQVPIRAAEYSGHKT